jgi:tetratricopeptide (TPR) repeat protein
VEKKQGGKAKVETNLEDYENYFDNDKNTISDKKKGEMAEKERVKGNEAIKSKDFDEAITYYTRSIELDSRMYQSYGNRALAYLKKKGRCLST